MLRRSPWIPLTLVLAVVACQERNVGHEEVGEALPSYDRPTLLAEGVISTGNDNDELFPALSPDERTLYFVRRIPDGIFTIHVSEFEDGAWTEPEIAPFSGEYSDQEPALTPDGSRLFFTSNRPVQGEEPIEGRDLWVVERNEGEWSDPRHVGAPVSGPPPPPGADNRFLRLARGPRADHLGRLCFWADRPEDSYGHTDLYCSRIDASGFSEPVNLGSPPNSEHYETGLTISPDNDFMSFSRDCPDCEDALGAADIYVSYSVDGVWGPPENLGAPVNSSAYDFAPLLSPSGRHLLFSSNRNVEGDGIGRQNIYIVDLEALGIRP